MKRPKISKNSDNSQPTMLPVVVNPSRGRELQVQQSMNQVFSNDLLREKILEHVIYPAVTTSTGSNPQINYRDIQNLRLVQKSWLLSSSRILRQNRHPLFHLHDRNNIRLFVSNAEEHNRLINSIIQTITRPPRLEPYLPTFRLDLICAFFIPENHKILSEMFENCGSGLVSLGMIIPKTCTMPLIFPPVSLQSLQRLTIEFASHNHNEPDEEINPSFQENSAVTFFIQQLLNSTTELRSVEFKCCSSDATDPTVIPFGFQHLSIPSTVSKLLLRGPFSSTHLEITVPRARRGHVKNLHIRASAVAPFLDENTVYKVLERHGSTIETLKLSGGKHFPRSQNNQRHTSFFNLPPMKNLRTLSVESLNWLCVNNFSMTSVNFPKLTTFEMNGISVDLFDTITAEARRLKTTLKSVENLQIWLVSRQFGFTLPITCDRMDRLHETFRDVTNLEITVCGEATCGLKYIFREMGQLKSLTINVRYTRNGDSNLTSAAWEGLFIGAPDWVAKGLKENPDYWDFFQGKTGYDRNPSIVNLKALSKLTLCTINMDVYYLDHGEIRRPLLSEVTFNFAFLKMPELRILQLFGRFQPNQGMINLWKNRKETTGLGEPLVHGMNRSDDDDGN